MARKNDTDGTENRKFLRGPLQAAGAAAGGAIGSLVKGRKGAAYGSAFGGWAGETIGETLDRYGENIAQGVLDKETNTTDKVYNALTKNRPKVGLSVSKPTRDEWEESYHNAFGQKNYK